MRENLAIRKAAKEAGVALWRIAYQIGVSEPTLIRWLRVPLSSEKEAQIFAAINDLKEKG